MNNFKILVAILFMVSCTLSYAQDNKVIKGFSGGMETAFYMFEGDKHDYKLESNKKHTLNKE